MKSIIVGTAGHVDHGKTALVKALTGVDTDRLEEEKRRGITIDLGFAHMTLPDGQGGTLRLGFVDVPGHERFVRNMLAGIGGIDLVLLVIAADESIKPQTREHFEILQLLGVQRGITVLTKSDAVDAEMLDVVRLEVEEFLRGTFLESPRAPIVAVSALTGAGLDDLKQAIIAGSAQLHTRDSQALARLPIDRVFSVKGFGTVVTGTLVAGTIRREDELEVFPGGLKVRVRGLQVHGESSDQSVAGQRTALNLSGASADDLSRGMMLAPASRLKATKSIDVHLQLLASAPHPLKDRARVHFHAFSMESTAQLALHRSAALNPALQATTGNRQLSPGASAFARIRLPEPALFLPGDRFIIRQFSPVITIGGGVVVDATPMPRLKQPALAEFLNAATSPEPGTVLLARIFRRGHYGLTVPQIVVETGWRIDAIELQVRSLLAKNLIFRSGDLLLDLRVLSVQVDRLKETLAHFHKQNPLAPGVGKEELREKLGLSNEVFQATSNFVAQEKKIAVDGDLVRLAGHKVTLRDDETKSKLTIEEAFLKAGLKVPALQEILAGLKLDRSRAQQIVTMLLRDKTLIKISDDLVFHRSALDALRGMIAERKAKSRTMDVAVFKEMTGVSRKYAIPLLEYLDRERVTRRVGDAREIL